MSWTATNDPAEQIAQPSAQCKPREINPPRKRHAVRYAGGMRELAGPPICETVPGGESKPSALGLMAGTRSLKQSSQPATEAVDSSWVA